MYFGYCNWILRIFICDEHVTMRICHKIYEVYNDVSSDLGVATATYLVNCINSLRCFLYLISGLWYIFILYILTK